MARQALPAGAVIEDDEAAPAAPARQRLPEGAVIEDEAAPAQVQAEPPGAAATFAMHTAEGLTSNFAGEIGGLFKALGPDARGMRLGNAYRVYRDQVQSRIDAGAQANPKAAIAGNVIGGVAQTAVPVVGPILRTPGVGGAVAGLGASKADLTQGEFGQAAADVGKGAAIDLATAGAFKLGETALQAASRSAPARQAGRAVKDLLTGVKASVQDKSLALLGGREAIPALLEREAIPRTVLRNPAALAQAVEGKLEEVGASLGNIYRQADANVPQGVLLSSVEKALNQVKAQARARGDHRAMGVVDSEIAGLKSLYEETGSVLSASQLHGVVQRLGSAGYTRQFLDPSAAAQLSREMHGATRELLQTHIDRVAKAFPDRVPGREQLQDLNQRYSQLRSLGDIADDKATRLAREAPTMGQHVANLGRTITGGGAFINAAANFAAGDVRMGTLSALAGGAAAAAPYIPTLADEALIRVARAARAGGKKADLMRFGATLGLERSVVAQVIADEDRARAQEAQYAPGP